MLTRQNIILLIAALVLCLAPLALGGDFVGTDDKAVSLITQLRPDYRPWFAAVFGPSPGAEHLLFAVQAALGAGLLGYCLYRISRKAA